MEGGWNFRYLELKRVILEGDTLEIMHVLRQKGSCWSWCEQLIEDIRGMPNDLQLWFVEHSRKEAIKLLNIRKNNSSSIFRLSIDQNSPIFIQNIVLWARFLSIILWKSEVFSKKKKKHFYLIHNILVSNKCWYIVKFKVCFG